MSEKTPIKVRGKRRGTVAEKWHTGKKRPVCQPEPPSVSEPRPRKQPRRRRRVLSKLESLPTEILQQIFLYSHNVELPAASPSLLPQFSNTHLQYRMTDVILSSVRCDFETWRRSRRQTLVLAAAATRLFDCKFFTWTHFQAWCRYTGCVRNGTEIVHGIWSLCVHPKMNDGMRSLILPPKKLFYGPWNADKQRFLQYFANDSVMQTDSVTFELGDYNKPWFGVTAYEELSRRAAQEAITVNEDKVLPFFVEHGTVDNEMFRAAVIDHGCHRRMVAQIIRLGFPVEPHALTGAACLSANNVLDFLDPLLWTWAEQAQHTGDESGEWLIRLMQEPKLAHREAYKAEANSLALRMELMLRAM